MKYTVLEKLSYEGKTYEKGQIIDITDKTVANDCLERNLITKDKVEEKSNPKKVNLEDEAIGNGKE